ncbi:MAG TPA: DUF1850 domain-containing protein [Symbiobacteriaceae bacterium]|nr:DUF1850 domain-containing protein [Symbiobacteriaceae bacterium]
MAVALLFAPVQALTVRPARGSGLLWAVPASTGSALSLTWTHTVTRRPVSETYRVGPSRQLELETMVFDQFGPNLPSEPEPGTTWQLERDRIIATGYDRRFDTLWIGVGPLSHRLVVGGREWDLVAGVGPDRSVRIQVERTPLLLIIATEVWQWRTTRSPF